jgi:hypothetical protein
MKKALVCIVLSFAVFGGGTFAQEKPETHEEFVKRLQVGIEIAKIYDAMGISESVSYKDAIRRIAVSSGFPANSTMNEIRETFVRNGNLPAEMAENSRKRAIEIFGLPEDTIWIKIDEFVEKKVEELRQEKIKNKEKS